MRIDAFIKAAMLFIAFAHAGCNREIRSDYGRRSGDAAASVNATSVLADMFEAAGKRVSSTTFLAPRVGRRADVFVWFPNDFAPPDKKHREWFETWLRESPERVLIYVGRDFDAEPGYWKAIQTGAPIQQQVEMNVRLNEAVKRYDDTRDAMPDDDDAGWFVCKGKSNPRPVRTLAGDDEWTEGIDPAKLGIELNGRFQAPAPRRKGSKAPATNNTVLLESEGDPLVMRRSIGESELFVVTNGSFLLNVPLVNHEHRKLADRLIAECGDSQRVMFVESWAGGPEIHEKDPETQQRSGLQIFTIEPFDLVLWHLCVAGLIFCLSRYPIFGRPHPAESAEASDFHKHIAALGKLIERSRDRAFATARIEHFLRTQPATRTYEPPTTTPPTITTPSEK